MRDLKIEVVENGFIVREGVDIGVVGKKWVFDSPEKLANHVEAWSGEQMKKETFPTN